MSFSAVLRQNGFDSRLLNWYMNYACRDDYGALASDTSAWAGIHYFFFPRVEEKGPLTWPEGNGWITRRLSNASAKTFAPARWCTASRRTAAAQASSPAKQSFKPSSSSSLPLLFSLLSSGRFSAPPRFCLLPWLTANLTLDRYPESRGAEPSWDTVFLDFPHARLRRRHAPEPAHAP